MFTGTKEQTIDHLLGALTLEQKAGQLFVFGLTGAMVTKDVEELVTKHNCGGIRTTPYARTFIRYLPDGAPGVENVNREPLLTEKMWDPDVPAPSLRAPEYAAVLNRLRKLGREREHAIPLHFTIDYESGEATNYLPPGAITLPQPMGLGRQDDKDLVYRAWLAVARQYKAMGFDILQSPVVDVNTNPGNPEVSTRSFGPDPAEVTACARACMRGLLDGGLISTLKHFPGRGSSGSDAHFSLDAIELDRNAMDEVHLAPYRVLIKEGNVPAIMLAHSLYPCLDGGDEIATVSKPIVTGLLREELGFDGVITTDSMTMGGLMAKYSVAEACVRAIDAGVDILLLKDDNRLRYEALHAIADAVEQKRLTEDRINESLRRIWSMKWEYGMFQNDRLVQTEGLEQYLFRPEFQDVGRETARRSIQILRDRDHLLPLRKDQKVLLVDRVTAQQLYQNDSWNHPAMLWEFLREYAPQVSCVDYTWETRERAQGLIDKMAPLVDVLVATAMYHRGGNDPDLKPFLADLTKHGKPVVLVSNNPFEELIVPPEIGTVVVSYSLMRQNAKAAAEFLFGGP